MCEIWTLFKVENMFAELELEVGDFFPEQKSIVLKMCDFSNFQSKNQIKNKNSIILVNG